MMMTRVEEERIQKKSPTITELHIDPHLMICNRQEGRVGTIAKQQDLDLGCLFVSIATSVHGTTV